MASSRAAMAGKVSLNNGLWGLAEQLANGQPLEIPAAMILTA